MFRVGPGRIVVGDRRFPVLNPYSNRRLCWDVLMLALICFITVVTPFELTFIVGASYGDGFRGDDDPGKLFIFYFNRMTDLAFLCDMVLSFNTSYFDPNLAACRCSGCTRS